MIYHGDISLLGAGHKNLKIPQHLIDLDLDGELPGSKALGFVFKPRNYQASCGDNAMIPNFLSLNGGCRFKIGQLNQPNLGENLIRPTRACEPHNSGL